MALEDTLKKLKDAEEQDKQWEKNLPAQIVAWEQAISKLLDKIEGWLDGYQQAGLLTFDRGKVSISEKVMGVTVKDHLLERLILNTSTPITIVPVGMFIFGARGRVDMFVRGRPMEPQRVILLRKTKPEETEESWVISIPDKTGQRQYIALKKDSFEKALDFLLSN